MWKRTDYNRQLSHCIIIGRLRVVQEDLHGLCVVVMSTNNVMVEDI